MKIGLVKETKYPIDNRVALTPNQIKSLIDTFPHVSFVVQSSDIRAYTDQDYSKLNIQVVENLDDCDILFGIKEVNTDSLLTNKHYFFFGHIAKMQAYNRNLLKSMISKMITFTDYEYLVDNDGKRVCAFGWWAGAVGVYYTLRGYGLKYNLYELPKPDLKFTLNNLLDNLKKILLPKIKIVLTGTGRVSEGAQFVLNEIGVNKVEVDDYLSMPEVDTITYCVADINSLVKRVDGKSFNRQDFAKNPDLYRSDFMKYGYTSDILISAHYWGAKDPIYLTKDNLRDENLSIRMIGDITCDIMGSIEATIRSSSHDAPYYDYNPITEKEEEAFSSPNNITMMAVDTCPNALALDSSEYFGDMIIKHVILPILENNDSINNSVVENATILRNGRLTSNFSYLTEFARGED